MYWEAALVAAALIGSTKGLKELGGQLPEIFPTVT